MIVKSNDILALLPFFVAVFTGIVVVIVDVFHRTDKPRTYVANIGAVGMVLTAVAVWFTWKYVPSGPAFGGLIYHDKFTALFNLLFIGAGLLTIMYSPKYLRAVGVERGEYYGLVILGTTGMMLMAASGDLLMTFLGIEVMSVAVYVLVGFLRSSERSAEGAAKYFFLGAFASAVILYGMALMYGTVGSTSFEAIAAAVTTSATNGDNILVVQATEEYVAAGLDPLFFIGMVLIIGGMGFKIALVPFHMWTPDAYEGAPSSIVGYMATAVKAAGFAALIRILFIGFGPQATRIDAMGWGEILFYLSLITVIVGNLLAIVQDNVKRMLAYSSIAHAGYALIGVVAAAYIGVNEPGVEGLGFLANGSVIFYLVAYTFPTLGAFGCLAYLGRREREIDTYNDLNAVGFSHPAIAFLMSVFMLSSAGIPPTAGFFGKFYVFETAVVASKYSGDSSFIYLVVIAILASVAGAFYYLRVIVHMYMRGERGPVEGRRSGVAQTALAICAAGTLIFGIYPKPLLELSNTAIKDLQGIEASYPSMGIAGEDVTVAGTNYVPPEPEPGAEPGPTQPPRQSPTAVPGGPGETDGGVTPPEPAAPNPETGGE